MHDLVSPPHCRAISSCCLRPIQDKAFEQHYQDVQVCETVIRLFLYFVNCCHHKYWKKVYMCITKTERLSSAQHMALLSRKWSSYPCLKQPRQTHITWHTSQRTRSVLDILICFILYVAFYQMTFIRNTHLLSLRVFYISSWVSRFCLWMGTPTSPML